MPVVNSNKNMKPIIVGVATLIIALTVIFVFKGSKVEEFVREDSYPLSKHFKWRYKLVNESSEMLEATVFKAAAPIDLLANQKLVLLDSSLPFEKETDDIGNTSLVFTINNLAPYATTYVDLKAQLNFAIKPQAISRHYDTAYLKPSHKIESEHKEIKRLAESLLKASPKETLKAQYDWIKNNLEYSGYVKEDMGALYAVQQKVGDCTEYSYLMAALARASDIPARVMGGYVYSENSIVKSMDYHNWTEVWLDGRWHIIDPQKERFMEQYQDYLSVKILPYSNPQSNSHQITVSDKSIKVTL